jgi:hypothetical protein
MGGIDRSLRLIVAGVLLYFGLIDTSLVTNEVVRAIMVIFGVLNTVTSVVGFCPMYTLADLTTIPKKRG